MTQITNKDDKHDNYNIVCTSRIDPNWKDDLKDNLLLVSFTQAIALTTLLYLKHKRKKNTI